MSNNSRLNPRNPLLIGDLFHCVLDCLVTPLPTREERQTLAALARTCRAFSEPSLDRLWHRLDSLLPLIRSFSDVVNEDRIETPPSANEWLVIHRYSLRIWALTLGNEKLSLHFLQRTGLVLPNLRVFIWKYPRIIVDLTPEIKPPFDMASIWPLLTPQIHTLQVHLRTPANPKYQLFLENYPHLCPNLKSVQFVFSQFKRFNRIIRPASDQALSQAICSNADWEHVKLSPLTDDVILKHLGMSRTLKTVSLNLAPRTSQQDACFGPEDTPFRNVMDLTLTLRDSLDIVTSLLRPRDQAFHCFEVTLCTLTTATEVLALLTALVSPQRTNSLRSVIVRHNHNIIHDMQRTSPPESLSYDIFRPLTSLVHLSELVIHLNHPMSLNDNEFADLIRHWPLLKHLKMTCAPAASKLITLRGLLSLLASCQELREIGLTLDARDVPTGTYPHSYVTSHLITSPITLYDAPLTHPGLVAHFLLRHMPRVPGVYSQMTWSDPAAHDSIMNRGLWLEVNEWIGHPMFSKRAFVRTIDPEVDDY